SRCSKRPNRSPISATCPPKRSLPARSSSLRKALPRLRSPPPRPPREEAPREKEAQSATAPQRHRDPPSAASGGEGSRFARSGNRSHRFEHSLVPRHGEEGSAPGLGARSRRIRSWRTFSPSSRPPKGRSPKRGESAAASARASERPPVEDKKARRLAPRAT